LVTGVYVNRIGTAVPDHDIHAEFVAFARTLMPDLRSRALFARMADLAAIEHRYSMLAPGPLPRDRFLDRDRFYERGHFPSTAARMAMYEREALVLARRAIADLGDFDRDGITHLIVASCTGFSAPGLDFQIAQALGLRDTVERTIVGFMGCFAAVNALKLARHIIRSEPEAKVLVVNLELSSLHLQERWEELATMLSFVLFGDGCAVSLVSAEPEGLELGAFQARIIPRTQDLITWHIGDQGFDMHLSGQVPGRIRRWLKEHGHGLLGNAGPAGIAQWAVHAGGRSILDAVQHGLALPPDALHGSREVLRLFGNMSSATLVFVLNRLLRAPPPPETADGQPGTGIAMAFGPGLTVETFRFRRAA
jgi:predicted naringenin-chalcone synthase